MDSFTKDKFEGCILGGAIGDAWGSSYELSPHHNDDAIFYIGEKPSIKHEWQLTDDTLLNLATCEVLKSGFCSPESLGEKFVEYFNRRELVGIGASTLKAIQDLKAGYHWTQSGRKGEYAAGNGSAMRMAPFAFFHNYERTDIRNFSRITHDNDEAYAGALAVFLFVKYLMHLENKDFSQIVSSVILELPDTNVKDRMVELNKIHEDTSIMELAKIGNDGYVVNSIPFSIYSALKINELGFENVIYEIINSGGDTDTNASIAGQLMGTYLGHRKLPSNLLDKLKTMKHYHKIEKTILS